MHKMGLDMKYGNIVDSFGEVSTYIDSPISYDKVSSEIVICID